MVFRRFQGVKKWNTGLACANQLPTEMCYPFNFYLFKGNKKTLEKSVKYAQN